MMEVILLRFDAPLMSFGAPIVDQYGFIQPYPALSMMAGLLANALGYEHAETARLERLQERLRYAVREDRRGQPLRDYQTVDLSQPFMQDNRAWTTRGVLEKRMGGAARTGTHIRLRDYWADAVYTVALTLEPADASPTLVDLEQALRFPARPLFIGRKPCLPAAPLFLQRMEAASLLEALQRAPLDRRADSGPMYRVWWQVHPDDPPPGGDVRENRRWPVTDRRDWANQIHVGSRWIAMGELSIHTAEGRHEG
ncbi:type I-E CRISPR-associated protein Cas5/CasD [Rhodothermus profundi]|uniref:CRISPR-associated protein, Cas5e family n=1 Tax=Rhodothermus profundi TaxID=633813 RepID=A0A1M6UE62_9BACT|nr:type I-E CRISPR-associated protein Cas5/CasD [Rhodothermus profundi]SHK67457.1 CRISPR-associated protein, Cas5e family [Rhodothermus profundi]